MTIKITSFKQWLITYLLALMIYLLVFPPENRVMFAKKAQNFMLDEGFDMEFTATGKEKRTLECKYVLAGNVLAHKLSKGPFLDTVRDYSFDKFILRDGFGNSWTWDFKKVDSK